MRSGRTKLTGVLAGALMLAGVAVPAALASAATPASHAVTETGCTSSGGPVTGTSTTSTFRGVTTTKTTYSGEITTTVIVPVGKSPAVAKFMVSDEAGNEYFATTHAKANAAASAFNRANPGRYIGNGVTYYAHTRALAQKAALNANAATYVNGVPVSNTPQFLATSKNGTAFWSNCSQARANALAARDQNRARKVFHATNASTGQVMTSAVSAKFANALAAYQYFGSTPGEVAAYGFNCQILTANSLSGIITALQTQLAAMPYSSFGGDYIGYDASGTNVADIQMFRGATQADANAAAAAFGNSIVKGGVFVADTNGMCATVGTNIKDIMAIQNREKISFAISSTSITTLTAWTDNSNRATLNATTGLMADLGGSINVGGQVIGFGTYMLQTDANQPYNPAENMSYYDNGYPVVATTTSPALAGWFTTAHATLPTTSITCVPYSLATAGAPASWTGISYNCPAYYHLGTTP